MTFSNRIIRLFIFLVFMAAGVAKSQSQSYQNEWINYSIPYHKFKITETGLYRIDQAALAAIGLGQSPVQHFVLWRNGKEVPLYTSQTSGVLASNGYLEFWGEGNDGKPDQSLYRNPSHQLNDQWSLFTDSATYFLASDSTSAHLRQVVKQNLIPANPSPEPFFLHQQGIYFRERINEGYAQVAGGYIYSSMFDVGEGWSSGDLYNGQSRILSLTNLFPFTGASAPSGSLKLNMSGNAPNNRSVSVRAGATELSNQVLSLFDAARWEYNLSSSSLSTGELQITITPQQSVSTDRITISKLELSYARRFHFGGAAQFQFQLPASSAGKYLEIEGFAHNNQPPILIDVNNLQRYQTILNPSGKVCVNLDSASLDRKLILFNPSIATSITNFVTRNFIDFTQTASQGDYLIIAHPNLSTTSSGTNVLEQYRDFRSSAEGGSYVSRIYFIDQLEDQFSYGIKRHPNSIRNFVRFVRNRFSRPIKAVFLIGKGVVYTSDRYNESNPNLNKLSFIPTFGSPASDILLVTESMSDLTPQLAIGRLSVISAEEIGVYLDKIRQAEAVLRDTLNSSSARSWTKNVVHIIGSGEESLGNMIMNSMNRFAAILRGPSYGAQIYTFSKLSPAPIAQLNASQIYKLYEEGIGLMTYFGHSTANTLEYNLDQPAGYNNPGKYPVHILLGCRAGNNYNFNLTRLAEKETISEQYLLAPQRGGIAAIASTSLGLVSYLELQNEQLLHAACSTLYGSTLGDIINRSVVASMNIAGASNYLMRVQCEQLALHGDPVLRFYANNPRPDFVIEPEQLKIDPSPVSVANGSFNLSVKLKNTGRAISGPVVLSIKRTFPDGDVQVWRRDTVWNLYVADTLTFQLPITGNRDKGINRIEVCIDPDNVYAETTENNNCASVTCLVFDDELRPIYPYPYSIMDRSSFIFSASTANVFSGTRTYQMEIDTTALFNSSLLVTQRIQAAGGLIQFNPSVVFLNNTVYYWRVAPLAGTAPTNWSQSSFLYSPAAGSGYNQSHYFQHRSSEGVGIQLDSSSRRWTFGQTSNELNVRNGVFYTATTALPGFYLGLNGVDISMYACNFNRLVFNVLHPISLRPIVNAQPGQPGRYGSDFVCVQPSPLSVGAQYNFEFNIADTSVRRKVVAFMDSIPDGHYVVVRNFMQTNYPSNAYAADWKNDQQWLGAGQSVYHRLLEQGFTAIDSFNRNRVFAFVYRKNRGQDFVPKFSFSNGIYDQLFFSTNITSQDSSGIVRSPLFGPAQKWLNIQWQGSMESPRRDSVMIRLRGINQRGATVTVLDSIRPPQFQASISAVDALQYPYLQVELHSKDNFYYTPFQLAQWQLINIPAPEGALAPALLSYFKDTVEQGEPIVWKIAFRNVSDQSFDSLAVQLLLTNSSNQQFPIPITKLRPLPPGDSVHINLHIPSSDLSGLNSLQLLVNPPPGQTEQFLFNNLAFKNVLVNPDRIDPTLDVTVDGRHIKNGETILNHPDILIQLTDNSKWLPLKDTSAITVWLRYPSGFLRRFYYRNDTLRFFPNLSGQLPNQAMAQFRPYLTETGLYELLVSARDYAGNKAGIVDYRITFRITTPAPRFDLNFYPNPFTSQTRLVYTLWGEIIPDNVSLQIFNAFGQLVRLVSSSELGPMRLGRNVSTFEWDGSDAFGHQLASGIYFCRLVAAATAPLNPYPHKGAMIVLGQGKIVLQR